MITLILASLLLIGAVDASDTLEIRYVKKVDATNVKGVKSVAGKYDPINNILYMGKKPWHRSAKQHRKIFLHELVHSTGHKSKLDRFGGGRTDWFLEEYIAEIASQELMGKRFNTGYLRGHPLTRKLSSTELHLVREKAKEAIQWIRTHDMDLVNGFGR